MTIFIYWILSTFIAFAVASFIARTTFSYPPFHISFERPFLFMGVFLIMMGIANIQSEFIEKIN